jgi:hypothetical protein
MTEIDRVLGTPPMSSSVSTSLPVDAPDRGESNIKKFGQGFCRGLSTEGKC